MRIELDASFVGEEGMVKVWNETNGFLQVTTEGHLLPGKTTAWVTQNSAISELADEGLLVILSKNGSQPTPPKKNGKKAKVAEELSPNIKEEDLPVVQGETVPVVTDKTVPERSDS